MHHLIIKTSSMGDIIHCLPAVTDAARAMPGVQFDWVVEESFSDIPAWHPAIKRVIPVALRRWRKQFFSTQRRHEWRQFKQDLQQTQYDKVIDAQGLVKSAFVTCFTNGERCGLDKHSAWEPLACFAYQQTASVAPNQHAITRMRELFAKTFGYESPTSAPDFGIPKKQLFQPVYTEPYLVFLHATTWNSKQWPLSYWQELVTRVTAQGKKVLLPWGNTKEQINAKKIANNNPLAIVLPKLTLTELAAILAYAQSCVSVDTGLGHMAAALSVPMVSLYSATDPKLTGAQGENQIHLSVDFPCAPCQKEVCHYKPTTEVTPACFDTITVEMVMAQLGHQIPS